MTGPEPAGTSIKRLQPQRREAPWQADPEKECESYVRNTRRDRDGVTGAGTSVRTGISQARPGGRSLTTQAALLCGLLIVQFFAGMITNLYVTIPANHPGAGTNNFFTGAPAALGWAVPSGPAWLAVQAALGMALAAASLAFIVNAVRSRERMWIWLSVAGALLLIGAGFNGASFLVFGHDFSSLIMSGLFALSLGSYLAAIYLASRRVTTGQAP